MTNRIVVAKTGYNALTETNTNNLAFSSIYNTLKYDTTGHIQITVPGGTSPQNYEATVVTHSLGYYPFFVAYIDINSNADYYLMPLTFADAGVWAYDMIYATTTTLVYRSETGDIFSGTVPSYTVDIYYKIFKNNLNL